jgi:poly(beta-D-mannuronate) lyase
VRHLNIGKTATNFAVATGLAFVSIGVPFEGASTASAFAAEGCFAAPAPVISLGFGSRYAADSKSRSDIDEESNASVDEALKPVDKFIQDLSRDANVAAIDPAKRQGKAGCVFAAILVWAKADALSDLQTMNASLAIPSRVGGIAVAYGQVRGLSPQSSTDRKIIEDWLKQRAAQTKNFFDTEAPKNASRNNLRAWASFAVGEIGILTRVPSLAAWSLDSNKTMILQSDSDGSLPLEMAREKYALHYQLHAISPLMTSMARLCEAGYGTAGADFNRLRKIARFSVDSVQNPDIVAQIADAPQKFETDLKKNAGMLTWLEPYKALTGDEPMKLDMPDIRPMLNSKLGGDLTRLYGNRSIKCKIKSRIFAN